MEEEKTQTSGAKWAEMMMGMLDESTVFTAPDKALEPLMELTRVQQQNLVTMYLVCSEQMGKIGEANYSGNINRMWEAYLEFNREIFNSCQEAMKKQAPVRYEFLRTFIPARSSSPATES
jgi:hypothetical protein